MSNYYTIERNAQMLIYLLKAHGIKKVIVSPGATNICLVASIQQDSFFELYSAIDERSAAYMACGMAAESGEPVVLTCTGATASRNYFPAMTEAFYRHLPILAITSTQHTGRIGQNIPQVIDRSVAPLDTYKMTMFVDAVYSQEDEWAGAVRLNTAILELSHGEKGPVLINLVTEYSRDFSVVELPETTVIRRIETRDTFPQVPKGKVVISIGAHARFSKELSVAIETFCENYNAVVWCDHTSNYDGKYKVFPNLITWQAECPIENKELDLLIDIGDVSGAYMKHRPKEVWRVSKDGFVRDTYKKLTYVFDMEELSFFEKMIEMSDSAQKDNRFYRYLTSEYNKLLEKIPELPFSNIWIAQYLVNSLPHDAVLHLGILNTLRSWDFFLPEKNYSVFCNTGGFGIDGCVSSLMGAALASPDKMFFGIVGDLAFFYDMNVLGNRHVSNNVRLMVINNGRGTEFKNYNHFAAKFKDTADEYIAAAGHFGNQSRDLVRHYSGDLGFEYLVANNKKEFIENVPRFLKPNKTDKPILFEVFTDSEDESKALEIMNTLLTGE